MAETKASRPAPGCATRSSTGSATRSGIPPLEVVLVRPGSLPKTSSGKLQRSLCKAQYLGEALQALSGSAST